jgi:hypothetical protein
MRWFIAITAAGSLLLAACGGGGDDEASPTSEPTREPSAVATQAIRKTPTVDIREADLATQPEVLEAIEETGAVFIQEDVIYTDLTNDGFDEAVVPLSSEGTAGYVGFLAYMVNGDLVELMLQEYPGSGSAQIEVQGDKLLMIEAAPGPDDPECCPSYLQTTTYAWNGTALAVESVTTDPNPDLISPTPLP